MISTMLVATTTSASTGAQVPAPRATTADGVVEGITLEGGVRAWRGIPFAAPPVRGLRWRPPQPPAHWNGVRKADRFADQCTQARVFDDMVFRSAGTSEDCLYLNVWAPPASATGARPVLVYFYGGGFVAGDGSEFRYDGASMARRGIVVVTVNYRLGAFGFLAHPALAAESPDGATGNYALLDQVAALKWVQANARAFGGDPARVTIGGESAGSVSVSALMASPLARGLFARAIGESGSALTNHPIPTRAQAESAGVTFAALAGASSIAELRDRSAMEILAASMAKGAPNWTLDVDGAFLREQPESAYAAGRQARVPLLAGWNSTELGAWYFGIQGDATPQQMRAILQKTFGARATDAERYYPLSTPSEAARSAIMLASDLGIVYETWKWQELHARTSNQPVYRYVFAQPRPCAIADCGKSPARATGAVHSAEIEYALGNLATNRVYAWTAEDHAVGETMESYFANFVKSGDPNGASLPSWPVFVPSGDGMGMRIGSNSHTERIDAARLGFLSDNLR